MLDLQNSINQYKSNEVAAVNRKLQKFTHKFSLSAPQKE